MYLARGRAEGMKGIEKDMSSRTKGILVHRFWSLITTWHSEEPGLLGERLFPVLGQKIYKMSPEHLTLESKKKC